jgi:hypothetical protein
MFGGPLDMTPFGALVKGIGVIYWLLAAAGLWWALRGSRPWKEKLLRALPVVLVFGFVPGQAGWKAFEARQRFNAAKAHFDMRCKSAGEKILRVVENVEGIALLKLRPRIGLHTVEDDPMWPNAAMFGERYGDDYIMSFLGYEKTDNKYPKYRGQISKHPTPLPGYRYVDVLDSIDGLRYRYSAPLKRRSTNIRSQEFEQELHREVAGTTTAPRYGVTFEDIVDPEDRKHWIAGTKLQVVDLTGNEVIAEQTVYLWDTGLGSKAGFRSPWAMDFLLWSRMSEKHITFHIISNKTIRRSSFATN